MFDNRWHEAQARLIAAGWISDRAFEQKDTYIRKDMLMQARKLRGEALEILTEIDAEHMKEAA